MDRTALLDLLAKAREHHERLYGVDDVSTPSEVAERVALAIEPLFAAVEFLLKEKR